MYLGSSLDSMIPSVVIGVISASTLASSAWAIGYLFWLRGWSLAGMRTSSMNVPFLLSTEDIGVADDQVFYSL